MNSMHPARILDKAVCFLLVANTLWIGMDLSPITHPN